MMRWILFALAFMLAGCTDEASVSDGGADGEQETMVMEVAPEWTIGQWWTYEDNIGSTFDLVVAEDEGNTWQLLTNNLDIAWFDWSPGASFVGTIQKDTLSGKNDNGFANYFDFPLHDGDTWTTSWNGAIRTMTAEAGDVWTITARSGSSENAPLFAEYTYDPDTGYFGTLKMYSESDPDSFYEMTATASGPSYSGEVYRYTAADHVVSLGVAGPGTSSGTFDVTDEQQIQIDYIMDCGTTNGQVTGALSAPDENGEARPPPVVATEPLPWIEQLNCPGDESAEGRAVVDATPGTWRLDGSVTNTDGSFEIDVTLRSYETFTF